ncbi:MAG: MBL fold metallo-hydrolase [Salibaculum sp.]|jgi:L-ascorbate metabolism protein UlaG (beta-lactamase superfamily)|uniref:MBL fold metallo-hydrolase n=1 Tax=Roseovarius halophilus (ex Wu et al. 2025) TaxID=3376060 RepID=UPI00286FFE3F|nr:MBL fold metallo-hydrolase [Salibaculum sp.]MDR9427477.1 MBL fold metallo-hydrolase [Salibaculum sp.]MDR9482702.1 MBL fold metallo-hydrolase [Salibaculum sp.]
MIRYILPIVFLVTSGAALAQDRIPSHCRAFAQAPGMEYLHRASFRDPVADETVRISYLDHAMFLIQSETVSAMTDFTGWYGNVDFIPDVVTMNNAHSTHFTRAPDPAIAHVLEGWAVNGQPRDHDLDLGDMLIRNVHTDVRSNGSAVRESGNSIFVFEVAGLCVGHLGHLHHEPDDAQYAMLGRLDVVMAAVDGGLTLRHEALLRVMDRLRSSVVIPMHWFGRRTLESFLTDMEVSGYDVVRTDGPDITLSLQTLPSRPTVMVLEPEVLAE